jgi:hypothetical protein
MLSANCFDDSVSSPDSNLMNKPPPAPVAPPKFLSKAEKKRLQWEQEKGPSPFRAYLIKVTILLVIPL